MIAMDSQSASGQLAEKIERCASWEELVDLFYPGSGFDIHRRNAAAPSDLYQNEELCDLYDALHQEERAGYLRDIVSEIKQHVRDLPPGSLITEMGCGPGLILLGLASDSELERWDFQFTGIDSSPEMIRLARKRARNSLSNKSLTFRTASNSSQDAMALLARSELVIYRNVFSWFTDPAGEFALWRRLLRKSAKVYLREIRRDIPFNLVKRRILDCLKFRLNDRCLTFPPQCMVTAYLRALAPPEIESALMKTGLCFERQQANSRLAADEGMTSAAEMVYLIKQKP